FLAALDLTTGELLDWDLHLNAGASALVASGSAFYIGGYFTGIDEMDRNYIAKIDIETGKPTQWNANMEGGPVRAIAVDSDRVYVSGEFTQVGGETRNRIAALSATTG
ncbi:MAG: hypothetical protein WC889_10245, partial [Myxococcota bacterium]